MSIFQQNVLPYSEAALATWLQEKFEPALRRMSAADLPPLGTSIRESIVGLPKHVECLLELSGQKSVVFRSPADGHTVLHLNKACERAWGILGWIDSYREELSTGRVTAESNDSHRPGGDNEAEKILQALHGAPQIRDQRDPFFIAETAKLTVSFQSNHTRADDFISKGAARCREIILNGSELKNDRGKSEVLIADHFKSFRPRSREVNATADRMPAAGHVFLEWSESWGPREASRAFVAILMNSADLPNLRKQQLV